MAERRDRSYKGSGSAALFLVMLAIVSMGCVSEPNQPTQPIGPTQPVESSEPPLIGDQLPGSFHMTSSPSRAPYPLTIRIDHMGGPSRRSAEFEEGVPVIVDWSTLPFPQVKWIEVNGQDCNGTFWIQARFEVDLLLTFTDDDCSVRILGVHPEGGSHIEPAE